jgi:hypothetical protein
LAGHATDGWRTNDMALAVRRRQRAPLRAAQERPARRGLALYRDLSTDNAAALRILNRVAIGALD